MKCPHCNNEITTPELIEQAILKSQTYYDIWDGLSLGTSFTAVGAKGSWEVTLVEKVSPQFDSYGDSFGDVSMVFEVDERFYMKTGTTDSYGEPQWNNNFKEVAPKSVVMTKYEEI